MGRRLYVGNLPYKITDEDLSQLFAQVGPVESVRVMRDVATGRARGFAFVQMASDEAAQTAIAQFHEHQLDGRPLVVNEARPKPEGEGGSPRGPRFIQGDPGDRGARGGDGRREPRW